MIEYLFHLIGFCPDHMGHLDLIDFIAYNWANLSLNFRLMFGNLKNFLYIYIL